MVAAAAVVMAMGGVVTTTAAAFSQSTKDEELRRVVQASDGCVSGKIDNITPVEGGCEVNLFSPMKVFCIRVHECVTPFDAPLRYNNTQDCEDVRVKHSRSPNNIYYFFGKFLENNDKRMSLQKILDKTGQVKPNNIKDIFTSGNAPPL